MSRSAEVGEAERGGNREKEAYVETGAAQGELFVGEAGTCGPQAILIADAGERWD